MQFFSNNFLHESEILVLTDSDPTRILFSKFLIKISVLELIPYETKGCPVLIVGLFWYISRNLDPIHFYF